VDGKQSLPVPERDNFAQWIDNQTIAHVQQSSFIAQMSLFDIPSGKDQLFFDKSIQQYAISEDKSFAAIAESGDSGTMKIWYCPFHGKDRILLDSFSLPEGAYVSELLAVAPDRVFLWLEKSVSGQEKLFDIWEYIPGSEKQIIGQDTTLFAVSRDANFTAFYHVPQKALEIQNQKATVRTLAMDAPMRLLWDPRSELLLVQTAGEVKIFRMDGDHVSTIPLPPDGVEYIVQWA
jgi:hypothetical protein